MKRLGLFLVPLLLLSLLLVACGESATNTSAPTTAVSATSAASTSSGATSTTSVTTNAASTVATSAAIASTTYPLTINDGANASITLSKKPERIICLIRSCVDFMAELDRPIVGVVGGYYPLATDPRYFGDKAKSVTQITAQVNQVNVEEIVALKPDLVLGASNFANLRDALKNTAPLYIIPDFKTVADVTTELGKIAKVVDKQTEGTAAAKKLTDKLATYKAKAPRDVNTMVMLSYRDISQQFVATDGSLLCNVLNEIAKCNVKAPASLVGYGQISLENVLQIDPQALFVMTFAAGPAGWQPAEILQREAQQKQVLASNPLWAGISAVKNNRVYEVDALVWGGDLGSRSLGIVLDDLASKLYPNVFPAAGAPGAVTTQVAITTDLSYIDKSGYKGTLPKKAERVVCLWTDCLDIMKEIGLEPVAVGGQLYDIVSAAPYPLVDKSKPANKIGGSAFEPSIEEIIRAKPDLVIGLFPLHNNLREVLKATSPLYLIYAQSYSEQVENLKTIGRLTGKSAEAEKAAQKFQDKLAAYKAKTPRSKTVMPISTSDGTTFFVASDKIATCALLNELAKCPWTAGPNIKVDAASGGLNFTLEQILAADPEVIIDYVFPGQPTLMQRLKDNVVWNELKAVKNKQVFELPTTVTQPGGTMGLNVLLDTIMPLLYPDVFPKALP
jgi:iron complex transport system substrate-binding protein